MAGNARWASQTQKHPREDTHSRDCAANCKQTPFAAILSCIDSRVTPEFLFDQGIGDLFPGRVAGNSVVPILEDSLVYGTKHLGASLLFVLGHSKCGAAEAATESFISNPHHPTPSFAFEVPIYPAVAAARKIVEEEGGNPNSVDEVTVVTIDQHVIMTVKYLRSIEPFEDLIEEGKLLVKGGRYDLSTQEVVILV